MLRGLVGDGSMDMTQALNAQLAIMMFFALIPMLGMMQARRVQRSKIKILMPEGDKSHGRRGDADRLGR